MLFYAEKKTEGNYREPYIYPEATQVQGVLVSQPSGNLPVTNSRIGLPLETVDFGDTSKW